MGPPPLLTSNATPMAEEKENTDGLELTLDEEAMARLVYEAGAISENGMLADRLVINGKVWRLRRMSTIQLEKSLRWDNRIREWQNRQKEAKTAREVNRLNSKIQKAYAKKAAHKVLGQWLCLIPFAFALTWRRLYHADGKVIPTINSTEAFAESKVFYLANLGSSKQALVPSMMQVGEAVKERTQRMESAENMVRKDGLPKKEDSRSATSSAARRTTKR